MIGLCFFFFKQKTAYEMRISDWSSDVCSSDLACAASAVRARCAGSCRALRPRLLPFRSAADPWLPLRPPFVSAPPASWHFRTTGKQKTTESYSKLKLRSEEHTSELQSLMRISYAVFCLKKKKKKIAIVMSDETT